MTPRSKAVAIVFAAIVLGLILLGMTASFLVDWTWFASLNFVSVFWTRVWAKVAVFLAVFAASTVVLYINGALAQKLAGTRTSFRTVPSPWEGMEGVTPPVMIERLYRNFPWRVLIAVASLGLGLMVALGETGSWSAVLRYLYQVPYGKTEPMFGMDIGFYLFSLPFYMAVKGWLLFTLGLSAMFAGALYWVHGAVQFDNQRRFIAPAVVAHGSVLLGIYLAVKAWGYWLDRFMLVYGDNEVVIGANYTDVHVGLPLLWVMIVLSIAAAAVCFLNLNLRRIRPPLIAVVVLIAMSVFVQPLVSGLFERFYVKPNELQFEVPYIARNIAMTREAYHLENIEVKPFAVSDTLDYATIQNNRPTIDNIRLWDVKPLLDSYAQLQEIRTYYKFLDADVDRYWLNGRYQQVMTSARELQSGLLPANAQTWVNRHVLFTHGNGVVMSPVTQTSAEGLPKLYLQDIPPTASGGPEVKEPRIYFGESPDSYVIVKGSTPEFDYPKGDNNVYADYRGKDGVPIGSFANRLLFSWYYGDVNILLSRYITGESRIMLRRNIQQRVREIAPFLELDNDPYIAVSDGRLVWIQDAYTTSRWFPYSKQTENGTANYIRNSVKVTLDAYDGTVTFYISDPSDPIVQTYARIFPEMFRPFAEMPKDLHKHVRYPEDLFALQADINRSYHMDAPEVFYNREDLWEFPRQPAGVDDTGHSKMEPYFINIRLPGEKNTEFVLMLPMVPSNRENMIAWMAARCDEPDYGKLIVYTFPKEKLVYGPFQIQALINQNTEVSQQISLWNQMGSRVIRGNLLVVPIENSLLYVTPLYLRAQSGQLPELKRVIAVYGGQVVMEETLGQALAALFKAPPPSAEEEAGGTAVPAAVPAAIVPAGPSSDAARATLEHYRSALTKLKAGDWAGFGAELDAMKPLLEQMNKKGAGGKK